MKRNLILAFLLSSMFAIQGEDVRHYVSGGVGFPNMPRRYFNFLSSEKDFVSKGAGPFHLKYENRLKSWLGLGLSINHSTYLVQYSKPTLDTSIGVIVANKIKISNNNTAFNLRCNFHFLNPEKRKKMDLYLGLGFGYNLGKIKIEAEYPDDAPKLELQNYGHIGVEASLGFRYFFDENLGAFAELGYAKSLFQIGFAGRF